MVVVEDIERLGTQSSYISTFLLTMRNLARLTAKLDILLAEFLRMYYENLYFTSVLLNLARLFAKTACYIYM